MSPAKFEREVLGNRLGENDELWFPKWLRRYAMSFPGGMVNDLPVNRQAVVRFSKSLLENGAPAWQRRQAVRAVECYRDLVLQKSQPDLADMIYDPAIGWSGKKRA